MHTGFWLGNQKERDHLDDVCVDRRIKKWNIRQYNMMMWTGFIWLKKGTRVSYEHGNKPLVP